jgi:hypothetical protein
MTDFVSGALDLFEKTLSLARRAVGTEPDFVEALIRDDVG